MRIILSRKGFDSSYGGAPSPIIGGRPISLPIPASQDEQTTYGAIGLGDHVKAATKGRMSQRNTCHDDPMFADGKCWLGQTGGAQGHLRNQGVTSGDLFLFFGLFADPATKERHHRIFGYMHVTCHGSPDEIAVHREWTPPPRRHPHFSGDWGAANSIYHGPGNTAQRAAGSLRLTRSGGPLNAWKVPSWLKDFGLSYHAKPERWTGATNLDSVKRGQEFVCNIGNAAAPHRWIDGIIKEIES
ncbi:MAG: hypothetical protein KUG65_11630 [Sphingomonadaceae bacterium]|nr:hypothetical protein [Sphingomonadaceae bacterium]